MLRTEHRLVKEEGDHDRPDRCDNGHPQRVPKGHGGHRRGGAGAARGTPGHETALERFRFFNEVLVWHAHGEELAIFPAVEGVAPLVAEAYEKDHRGLDAAFEPWTKRSRRATHWRRRGPRPPSSSILDFHLFKEDTHLYRIVRERVPVPDQGKAVGIMAAEVPPDRQPELIAWMYPLIGDDDRENMLASGRW